MAQETAGTIGIPVLKNELLPYLTDYARRRERAELYKQKAEQRAAELAAKRAAEKEAELNRYIPPAFEIAKGGYWQPAIKKRMEAEQATALQRIKDAKTTAEKAKASQDYSNIMQELNYGGEQETQKQKENVKALRESGYNVDENALAQYYTEQAAANPNFFGTNHIVNFKEWAKSNPQKYINPAAIGTSLLKQYQPVSVGIKTKEGKDESFVYNPLFEPERVKDTLTGANIFRAQKPNLVKIQEALEANPNLREAADAYIDPIAAQIKSNAPGMSSTEAYTLAAEEFFGKSLPQGRAKETYDYSEVRPRKEGAGGGGDEQYTMSITTKAGPGKHRFNVEALEVGRDKTGARVIKPKSQPQYGTVGSKDDVKFVYSTEYSHPGNKEVRILQADEGDVSAYADRLPDGGYLLKPGFKYSSPTKRTLYFADKDLYFGGTEEGPYAGKNWTRIKKGDEVPTETALERIRTAKKENKPAGLVQQTGYELTANLGNGTSLNIFVPQESAGEIDKHIQMEQQKKRRKKGPETEVSQLGSGEVELIK